MLLVSEPILGDEEKAALSDVVECGWITMGERVRAFEQAFARHHGTSDAVAVNSCTAALHLALEGLGVGPGDEVLVPSLTFVATANSVLYAGATPVFIDIESLEIPLMSIADADAKCTTKTKAIIIMHYAGYLADRHTWRDFARSRGLVLIEDAAHAAGVYGAGTFGDAAAFSFYGNKNMTTAEGGVVLAADDAVLARIRQMRGHGMTSGTRERLSSRSPTYDVTMLGYNYRLDELRAAIGLVQLKNLEWWNSRRQELTRRYHRRLSEDCPNVLVPFQVPRDAAYHIMPVILPSSADRAQIMGKLRDAEIQTTIHYPPVHSLSFYRDRCSSPRLSQTEEFARRELTLPLHPKMEAWHVDRVAAELARALAG
ncbi:DegT/DnrJ/EryC1/StrS family aminotransferase [Microvirga massiliensis]|uniref:DegT/DnrJ/EryC1/StrS family aminotransferase n=1 Tax=Microvirga massiliensis TaxID=1033741 RepID=UPI00062B3D57|nr:DegT/DnrJ/EryC1/StrS aminotransferase family protein [Microvirga massiliensis]